MNTIQEKWALYLSEVVPVDAPVVQRQETRRAFYAGAAAALSVFTRISEPDITEDAGVQMLEGMHQELRSFKAAVLRGDA